MADESCVALDTEAVVAEAKVDEVAKGTTGKTTDVKDIDEEFESALERITSKLWDDRPRNKSKGKRKRVSKEEEKNLIKLLIQASSSCQNETESLEVIARKFLQLVVEIKSSESKVDDLSRRCSLLIKDKEDLTGQYKKSRLALSKLENLCRELQKHNRLMKEECDHRTKAEEAKRQELSSKFQSSIGEITNQMQDNHTKNQQLKTDNAELAAKLKGLVDQYEMREQYVDKVLKHKQIENQLLEAKLAQQTLIVNEEREQSLKEKQKLLQEALEYQKRCELLVKEEAELKLQLSMYTEKFEEFQKTLTKSNEVFGTFKKEMDKMTKTIKKLEKETTMWKQKWEKSNQSLLEIAGDNRSKEQQVLKVTQKNDKLEKLCRALQIERRELSQKLEGNNPIDKMPNDSERTASSMSEGPVENGCDDGGESELKPEAEQEPQETCCNRIETVLVEDQEETDIGLPNGSDSDTVQENGEQQIEEESNDMAVKNVEAEHDETTESNEAQGDSNVEKEYCEADQTVAEEDQQAADDSTPGPEVDQQAADDSIPGPEVDPNTEDQSTDPLMVAINPNQGCE